MIIIIFKKTGCWGPGVSDGRKIREGAIEKQLWANRHFDCERACKIIVDLVE